MGTRAFIVTVAALLAVAVPATANMIFTIRASSGDASALQQFEIPCNGGVADWTLAAPITMMAGNTPLGKITELSLQTDSEPYVNLKWAVEAGPTDTTFDFSTAVVSFSPLTNPQAYASAGVILTGDSDGATITGLFDGGKIYQARYNGGTVYANLAGGFTVGADTTEFHGDRDPASGYRTIIGSVYSIESQMKFTLSAGDMASATSRFEVIPEPATLFALFGVALPMLLKRRAKV
ncbi:MAG: PEP-CTERM sorting domain-containing protein [Planctomycetota bacterium]|nr:PEP-CTERM sorting domain-containing protein [Planctomycetota bacterium]